MSATAGYSHSEVKTGIFLTFCLILFVAMLFIWGDLSRYWRGRQLISVVFASVTSLRPDAPVRYNGVEVGRVKEIGILHLKDSDIQRLPKPFKVADLEKFPLSIEEKNEMKKMTDDRLQTEIIAKLAKRTMINLTLEVVNDKDTQRFRVDDDIKIVTTLMGDTSIEIVSGTGDKMLTPDTLVLGRSGDFFTNLAKSVEQVKEILNTLSEVVGTDERASVRNALLRLDTITAQIEKILGVAATRISPTWNKVDDLADKAKSNIERVGDAVVAVKPEVDHTLKAATDAVTDLRERVGRLADSAREAVGEVRTEIKPVFTDLQYITNKSKDDVPAMVKNAKDLALRFQASAGKLDAVLATGGKMMQETYPDIRRLVLALRYGAENFEEGTNLVKRKPWLIYNAAKEDPAVANAQRAARDLDIATRRFSELSTELQAVRRNLDRAPKEKLDRIDFILQELNVLSETLKYSGDATRRDVLPMFERKKGGFIPVPEEPDPVLKNLKPDGDTK